MNLIPIARSEYLSRDDDDISSALFGDIMDSHYCDALRSLINQDADIEPRFLGFMKTYRLLAELIPLDRIVIDVGCAYATQGWYFRHHKAYFGVDPILGQFTCIQWENSTYFPIRAQEFFDNHMHRIIGPSFAICNYCADESASALCRLHSTDVFTFYPRHS